jgi:hypothetical protein
VQSENVSWTDICVCKYNVNIHVRNVLCQHGRELSFERVALGSKLVVKEVAHFSEIHSLDPIFQWHCCYSHLNGSHLELVLSITESTKENRCPIRLLDMKRLTKIWNKTTLLQADMRSSLQYCLDLRILGPSCMWRSKPSAGARTKCSCEYSFEHKLSTKRDEASSSDQKKSTRVQPLISWECNWSIK